jgi:hypothetical protein
VPSYGRGGSSPPSDTTNAQVSGPFWVDGTRRFYRTSTERFELFLAGGRRLSAPLVAGQLDVPSGGAMAQMLSTAPIGRCLSLLGARPSRGKRARRLWRRRRRQYRRAGRTSGPSAPELAQPPTATQHPTAACALEVAEAITLSGPRSTSPATGAQRTSGPDGSGLGRDEFVVYVYGRAVWRDLNWRSVNWRKAGRGGVVRRRVVR